MNALTLSFKLVITSLSLFSIFLNPAMAETDMEADSSQQFRGVFYGAFPCIDCRGIAATLSLKNRKNYLLVTQKAQESTREYFEKGKYDWDEESGLLTLTSRKDSNIRKLSIKDDKTIIMHGFGGIEMENNEKKFTMTKRDRKKKASDVSHVRH